MPHKDPVVKARSHKVKRSPQLIDVTEKTWQAELVQLARMLGFKHYHTYRSVRSPAGWPDLALVRERLVLIEVKKNDGRVSPAQADWIRHLHSAGVEVYVARPDHLQQLALVLQARGLRDFWTADQAEARGHLLLELDPILNQAA